MTAERRAILYALLYGVLFIAVEAIGSRISGRISLWQIVWMRYLVHLLAVIVIWGRQGLPDLVGTRRPRLQFARSAVGFVMPATWIGAYLLGVEPLALAAGFGIVPLAILLIANGFLVEAVGVLAWTSAALSAVASLLVAYQYLTGHVVAVLPVLAIAISFALYFVLTRVLREEPTGTNLLYTAVVPFLAISTFLPFVWVTPALRDLPFALATGLLGLLGWLAVERMVQSTPLAVTAPLTGLQLVLLLGGTVAAGQVAMTQSVAVAMTLFLGALALSLYASLAQGLLVKQNGARSPGQMKRK